jgi:DNA-directed RNA polymerase subunit omega
MARVTITDCLVRIPNHFELTLTAAKRSRQLARGAEAKVPWGSHKPTVLALKEIAAGHIDPTILNEADLPVVPKPVTEFDPLDPILADI